VLDCPGNFRIREQMVYNRTTSAWILAGKAPAGAWDGLAALTTDASPETSQGRVPETLGNTSFTGFQEQDNVSPDWLVNPSTRRKLKLDKFFPEAGIAIRFIGLTAKGQGRMSDWEVMEAEQRDQTRAELCRTNGVQLVTVDPGEDFLKQVDQMISALARAGRALAQSGKPDAHKVQWVSALAAARTRAEQLRSTIVKDPEQMMVNLADGWRDRESGVSTQLMTTMAPEAPSRIIQVSPGQRVRHARFGDGVVTRLEPNGAQTDVVILFDGGAERKFDAGWVADKLELVA
jgi:hypothetical protein